MSRRHSYPPGVPCFVDTLTGDVPRAQRFYGGVFGWDFAGPGHVPGDPPGAYYVAQIDGVDVAGLGLPADDQAPTQTWNTYISVASADETAALACGAGGSVLVAPVDAPPAGRMAVLRPLGGRVLHLGAGRAARGRPGQRPTAPPPPPATSGALCSRSPLMTPGSGAPCSQTPTGRPSRSVS